MSSAISPSSAPSLLERVTQLYDRGLFLQAYQETRSYWSPATRFSGLSIDELVLGLRLAARLGGPRLSRRIAREALQRAPSHPKVRYFTFRIEFRGRQYFEHFRQISAKPELEGADAETQANWLSYSAVYWALLRDFENAHRCIDLAHHWNPGDPWVLSCEADVLTYEDRWEEALKTAEAAWEINPTAVYTARNLGICLLNLRRVEEAAKRLAKAAQEGESHEVVLTACWYLCALAETYTGEERAQILAKAQALAGRIPALAVLADRETQASIARARLDIAELADDHAAMEHWSQAVRSPFHRKVLENIRKNPQGRRIRLPFRRAIQKHNECLPTSIGSAMAAMGASVDAEAMAAELTFGGTYEWAAAEWLEKQGFIVRFFVARPEVAAALIQNGFAFVVTLEGDANAHAVAVVGMDEAAGTLMVHDPGSFRSTEYLLEWLGKDEAPLGPRAMVAAPPERAQLLDQLLPRADAQTIAAREAHRREEWRHGSVAAREVVSAVLEQYPSHPNARLLKALQDHEDGRISAALEEFKQLLEEFPGSAFTRSNLLACCRSMRNTALMRAALGDVVERALLPGIESQQDWRYPPPDYVTEYADLLRLSGATRGKAKRLFLSLLARAGSCASAWHNFADMLSGERDTEGALLGYRIASCLADRNEHYARAYADALAQTGRQEEGLAWLRQRVNRFGSALEGVAAWISFIAELEEAGHPERALAAAQEALSACSGSAELLSFVVPFQARMGNWSDAEGLLEQLQQTGNTNLFHRACSHFFSMRGELDQALEHAEECLRDSPLSMSARRELVDLIARRDGALAAITRAREWVAERPEHEDIEELYCCQLERDSYTSWRKYRILLHRTRRNREDGWAWCELAFGAMYDFELAGAEKQRRMEERINGYLLECDRTSPGEAVTLRAHANWLESRGEWLRAAPQWLEAVERDPANLYAHRHLWDCTARLNREERLAAWEKIQAALLRETGHSSVAHDIIMMAAERFGVTAAEEAVTGWVRVRPEDPEIAQACADLLLAHGHGRTDYERVRQMLLPQLNRFPFHLGLRLSHANALRKLGRFSEAEEVFHEIVRRHPGHSWSRIQLAWMKQRRGETEAALRELEQASALDPQNSSIPRAQAEILIEEQRFVDARAIIASTSRRLPSHVGWRESAIKLLIDCGDLEQAIATARAGVVEHPRGAYLWILLGRTLSEYPQFSAHGEIESCLRRSLSLNHGLYEAADYLAMLLVEQRRYSEAEQVVREVEKRLGDPSPALGRLAWIRRRKGEAREAVDDIMALLRQFPWYDWGWGVFLDWVKEDKSWEIARSFLAEVAPEQRTNTRLRQRRLEALAKAGEKSDLLDCEWKSLLHDFPEELPLHLIRYDALHDEKRWAEAAEVLRHIREVHPDSPYQIARWVEVLVREKKKDEAIAGLLRLFFAETEPSPWPANYAWDALSGARAEAYEAALAELRRRKQPTQRGLAILAAHALEDFGVEKRQRQPFLRAWFPHRGAREVLKLLQMVDAIEGRHSIDRAILFQKLSDYGYQWLIVRYWKKNRAEVEAGVESWSETMRALTGLKKYRTARRVFAGWRERQGVGMWVVANYVMAISNITSRQLKKLQSTCQAALAGLPHDHCARYLAYREAEACALLGEQEAFVECQHRYREYFAGKLEKNEWFESKRRYLLEEIPLLARYLENCEQHKYRAKVKSLRWRQLKLEISGIPIPRNIRRRWWWIIIWAALPLMQEIFRNVK